MGMAGAVKTVGGWGEVADATALFNCNPGGV